MDIIDIEYHLMRIYPDWFDQVEAEKKFSKTKLRALLVDDSQFFRNLIIPVINLSGYDVISSPSAENALEILKHDTDFDVVVSDIEMPGINGFDLCKRLRSMEPFKGAYPIIALSSRISDKDISLSKEVGFTEHIGKNEQKKIIHSLNAIRKSILDKEDFS